MIIVINMFDWSLTAEQTPIIGEQSPTARQLEAIIEEMSSSQVRVAAWMIKLMNDMND